MAPDASLDHHNPYAPPSAEVYRPVGGIDTTTAELRRRELLEREVSLRSMGFLYLLSGWVMAIGTVALAVFGIFFVATGAEPDPDGFGSGVFFGFAIAYGFFSWISLYIGRGLRNLEGKARGPAMILSTLGLLGFPVATLINAYFLYLLSGQKTRDILTPEYRQIVAATPHIRYRTPWWVWTLLVLLLAVVVAAIVIPSLAT